MLARTTSFGLLGLALAASLLTTRDARACSPPIDPADECDTVRLRAPGDSFPLNLVDEVRLEHWVSRGSFAEPGTTFPAVESIAVFRQTASGYEAVDFELLEGEADPNERSLSLRSPAPGDYLVTWADATCATTPSPADGAPMIGQFSVGAEAEPATTLGTLEAGPPALEDEKIGIADGGSCGPEDYVDAEVVRVEAELILDASFRPWASVAYVELLVDGTPAALDPLGPDAVEAGRVTMTIEALCDADGDVPTSSMVSEGSHRLTARATLWDRSVVESGSIDVTLDCDDAVDHTSGGCSLVQPRGPADGTTGWVLAAAGVAVVLGRRRASRR